MGGAPGSPASAGSPGSPGSPGSLGLLGSLGSPGSPGSATPLIAPAPLAGRRAGLALLSLAASAACFLTVESLPIGLLPQIAASTHRSLSATGLLVSLYALVVVATSVPLSHVTRRMSRRSLLALVAAGLAVGCVGSALAPGFLTLLAARIFTAAAQAVFWAVGPVEAANLVRPERRARALTVLFGGSAVGQVIGLPAGTAIGHAAGWRAAFVVLAALAVLLLALILIALPNRAPAQPHHDQGRAADRPRYRALILTTAIVVTAYFAVFTYASAILVKLGGLPRASVAIVLLGAGVAGTLGLGSGAAVYNRYRGRSIPAAVGLVLLAALGLWLFARVGPLVPLFLALLGLGQSLFIVAGQNTVLEFGPANGTAWFSTAFNVGIATGPLAGGLALDSWGLRAAPLAGAVIAAAALALALTAFRRRA